MNFDSNSRPNSVPPHLRRGGFTLTEVVLASTISIVLVLAFAVSQQVFIDQAAATIADEQQSSAGESGMAEIEQAIRMSEVVLDAAEGTLELSTRYYLDLDDAEEKVRFRLSGGRIVKEIDTGAGYVRERDLIENALEFRAHSLEIWDPMPREVYDPDWAPEATLLAGTINVAAKLIKDLTGGDSDWDDSYDPADQRIEVSVPGASSRKTITVTPPTPRSGLEASTQFTPIGAGKRYRALLYGNESDTSNQVAVVFENDQSIRLQSLQDGTLVGNAVAGFAWSVQESYNVKLGFVDGRAAATVDRGNGEELVGIVPAGTIDDAPLHFEVGTTGGEAAWDDLRVTYPYTEFKVVIDLGGECRTLDGGAARRQR